MEKINLHIVATPIGNLRDITYRAVDTLREVDFIICEDTRTTGNLLRHFEIKKELISFNAQSETKKISYVIERLKNGQVAALVSDAGTPCISDPGIRLVSKALEEELFVSGVPGPSASILALSISGLPTDSFVFEGFLPQKKGRQKKLSSLSEEERTIVLYESTYRIEKLLNELHQHMPDRFVVVCRELTKKFEELWRGKPEELIAQLPSKSTKGEFVVIISPKNWIV